MLVQLNKHHLNNKTYFRLLDKLLLLLEEGKHALYFAEGEEDIMMDSQWINEQPERIKQSTATLVEKLLTSSVYENPDKVRGRLKIEEDDKSELSLGNALKFLEDPLFVIMENSTSDGAFVDCIIRCFKKQGKQIVIAKLQNWLEYVQAGGLTQIVSVLKKLLARKPQPYRPRIFVVLDSNRNHSQDEHEDVRQVISFCKQNAIEFHCLHKREIENYLPLDVLKGHLPQELYIVLSAFLQLTPEQQDYYDLDRGFQGKSKVPDSQSVLFNGLGGESFKNLKNGFSVGSYNVKKEFYKLFEDQMITASDLQRRCSHQREVEELKIIITKLLKSL